MEIKKYDIWLADLSPKKGSTQSGVRPCIILQSNLFNKNSSTVILVALSTKKIKLYSNEFIINASLSNGLKENSRFLGNQIITLDKNYILKKLGSLEEKYYSKVYEALNLSLDLENMFLEY